LYLNKAKAFRKVVAGLYWTDTWVVFKFAHKRKYLKLEKIEPIHELYLNLAGMWPPPPKSFIEPIHELYLNKGALPL